MKTTFQIVRETPKALQINDGEATFWIQRRWMRADGTLTPSGEKARIEAGDKAAENNVTVAMPICWENDSAVGIDYRAAFTLSSSVSGKERRVRAFVSKKMINVDEDGMAILPIWLEKKARSEALKKSELKKGYSIIGAWG